MGKKRRPVEVEGPFMIPESMQKHMVPFSEAFKDVLPGDLDAPITFGGPTTHIPVHDDEASAFIDFVRYGIGVFRSECNHLQSTDDGSP